MEIYLIYFVICFCFYIIGAYATTDILRLLKGSDTPINSSDCSCPICNYKIPLHQQLPIFAYIKNHGACQNCKNKIPAANLVLEIYFFILLSGVSILLQFRFTAYILCIVIYEGTKLCLLLYYGKREHAFLKNLLHSLFNNFLLFSLIGILFVILSLL